MKHLLIILSSSLLSFLFITSCSEKKNPEVRFVTEFGEIKIELFTKKAPVTAGHFLTYVKENRFRDAKFYRAVRLDNQTQIPKIEVLQSGLAFTQNADTLPPITHETTKQTGVLHLDGTVSMARLKPGTANADFFICIGEQPSLDFGGSRNPDGLGFAAFGRVTEGMDVVKKINKMPTAGRWSLLIKPVEIQKMEIVE